jgi:CheY-like chemotaxis protein
MQDHQILIVEDENDIRESLKEFLESENFSVATAVNGEDALQKLSNSSIPKLILLDLLMPVMNGMEFRRRQVRDQRIADVPVIIMSADNLTPDKAGDLGTKFLKKPMEIDSMLSMIHEHFIQ